MPQLDRRAVDCIKEHLPYEISMMREAYRRLSVMIEDQALANAWNECFAMHARTLCEFFFNLSDKRTFKVRDFGDAQHQKSRLGEEIKPYYRKLNQQFMHLSKERTIEAADKIGRSERDAIYVVLDGEIRKFIDALPKEWRDICPL